MTDIVIDTALVIEPGKHYVIEIPGYLTEDQYLAMREAWLWAHPDSPASVLIGGARIARSDVIISTDAEPEA